MNGQQQSAQSAQAQRYMEEPPVPDDVIERIRAEMADRNEKPIDYVRRISTEIRRRVAGMSPAQIADVYRDFAVRYRRLFGMLCDPRFSSVQWDDMMARWAGQGGGEIAQSASKTDPAYQEASKHYANHMTSQFFPAQVVQRIREAQAQAAADVGTATASTSSA